MLTTPASRLGRIAQARQIAINDSNTLPSGLVEPWIAQSWQRCLAQGQRPGQRVAFEAVSAQHMRHSAEANRCLIQAARPILEQLGRTLADTRYFAILTNHEGVVIDVDGPIDRSDRRASVITRIGVDLSERSVGTTAIGAALHERQPVWLHRGEHFFQDTSAYSCAGAPLFGPDGKLAGMLDLTGIEAPERPELRHLVVHFARNIENAMTLQRPFQLLLRMNWPGFALGEDTDGLVTLDADGAILAANQAARQMLPELITGTAIHCRDLFALPYEQLFDAARQHLGHDLEVPLWSGLRLFVRSQLFDLYAQHRLTPCAAPARSSPSVPANAASLRDIETSLILKAVEDARGNVAQAARTLGISRATVYRKLGRKA